MNRLGSLLAALVLSASAAMAQNQTTPEQLQKMYDDALVQLKSAQDRKNELATENQKLQKKLSDSDQQLRDLRERLDTLENRAYFLREHYRVWQEFVELNPPIEALWSGFFNATAEPKVVTDLLGDGKWPFGVKG
jgi:predicted nuclease with TOPRIM domain